MTVFQPLALRGQNGRRLFDGVAGISRRSPGPVVMVSAGDGRTAGAVTQAFARAGADVVLLHPPGEEDAALEVAERLEALGRRCELFAGDLDDGEFCLEGAFHAAFQGSGTIDAVVNVAGHSSPGASTSPRDVLRQDLPGLRAMAFASAPHLTRQSCIIHIQVAQVSTGRALAAMAGWLRRELRDLPPEDQARVYCLAGSAEDTAQRAVALACLPPAAGAAAAG